MQNQGLMWDDTPPLLCSGILYSQAANMTVLSHTPALALAPLCRSNDALQPVLALMLTPGAPLRVLVTSEAIRATEALLLGSALESLTGTGAGAGAGAGAALDFPTSSGGGNGSSKGGEMVSWGAYRGPLLWPVQAQIQAQLSSQMAEQSVQDMLELRAQVLRCWLLLRSNRGFDLASLSPLVQAGTLSLLPLRRPLHSPEEPLLP